jgi:hypothetical protein
MIYVTGSRLGAWHTLNSDIDIIIVDGDLLERIGKYAKFRYRDIPVDVGIRSSLGPFRDKINLPVYDLANNEILLKDNDDIIKYIISKNRTVSYETRLFLQYNKPSDWLQKNLTRLRAAVVRYYDFMRSATKKELRENIRNEFI